MYFTVYKDAKGEWRWRLKAANHQIVATSGEGYVRKIDCTDIIKTIQQGAAGARVDVEDGEAK